MISAKEESLKWKNKFIKNYFKLFFKFKLKHIYSRQTALANKHQLKKTNIPNKPIEIFLSIVRTIWMNNF